MKINVPQEQVQQIIELYQQGKTRVQIKNELQLPFGDSVIKRVLEENNITIRSNPGAKKGGRKKIEVDQETCNKIIDLYVNKHYGLDRIVKELQLPFSFDKVKSILKENNIHIRNVQEAHEYDTNKYGHRKYNINDDYNLNSHNGAWLLGFIAADGYLPVSRGQKNRVIIGLSAIDKEVLEMIKKELEFEGPIREFDQYLAETNKVYPSICLAFTSPKLRASIEHYGIPAEDKTHQLNDLPSINQEYMFDFIRGFIDGDGTIYERKGRQHPLAIGATCANHHFITAMYEYIKKELKLPNGGSLRLDHNNLAFLFSDEDSNILGAKLYDNDYLALPRKKKKFNELRQYLPRD